ncbi:helix-turn-helix transcriptional regulator [Anaerofustis sp.]|uniref:helix-turn-helix domain-containing protein n=1 Tax=Anaerofustis sp. TaxID=1872517 RepID=UPI0025C1C7B2|nr:helix-turn-helix transcriptional regulator [Anaerofustis sp.]
MDTFDLIKNLCKKNNIAITNLEKVLGFSRGSIIKMKTSSPNVDRLQKIADYFNVTVDYLITGDKKGNYYTNPETSKIAQEVFDNPEMKILFDASKDLSPEDLKAVIGMVEALQRKEKGEDGL